MPRMDAAFKDRGARSSSALVYGYDEGFVLTIFPRSNVSPTGSPAKYIESPGFDERKLRSRSNPRLVGGGAGADAHRQTLRPRRHYDALRRNTLHRARDANTTSTSCSMSACSSVERRAADDAA